MRPRRMSGTELRAILDMMGLSYTNFGQQCGYSAPGVRISEMMSGRRDVPKRVEELARTKWNEWRVERKAQLLRELEMLDDPETYDYWYLGERKRPKEVALITDDERVLFKELEKIQAVVSRLEQKMIMQFYVKRQAVLNQAKALQGKR